MRSILLSLILAASLIGRVSAQRAQQRHPNITDVSGQHPDVVGHIKTLMTQAHRSNPDWPLLASELNGKAPPK